MTMIGLLDTSLKVVQCFPQIYFSISRWMILFPLELLSLIHLVFLIVHMGKRMGHLELIYVVVNKLVSRL